VKKPLSDSHDRACPVILGGRASQRSLLDLLNSVVVWTFGRFAAQSKVARSHGRYHDKQRNNQRDLHLSFASSKLGSRETKTPPTARGFAPQPAKKEQPGESPHDSRAFISH